jgi:hypothetical protein
MRCFKNASTRGISRLGLTLLLPVAALTLMLFPFAGGAQATGIVDQQQPVCSRGLVVLYGTQGSDGMAQTFTAGHTGLLNEVSVYISNPHTADFDLRAQICTISGGQPTLPPLASAQVPVPRVRSQRDEPWGTNSCRRGGATRDQLVTETKTQGGRPQKRQLGVVRLAGNPESTIVPREKEVNHG